MARSEETPISTTETLGSGLFAIEEDRNGNVLLVHNPCSPREILSSGEEKMRLEVINVGSIICDEASITFDKHVDNMVASLQKDKQQSPILVRAREDEEGKIVYDVIDGFHRVEAARKGGIETLKANVKYNCSDELMYDLRVLAVNSVKDVKFARKIKWIKSSFEKSKWSVEKNLTITQLLGLLINDTRTGRSIGLTLSETNEARDWIREKCITWNAPYSVLYQDMAAVEGADPDIINLVRAGRGGGRDGRGVFNEYRFKETIRNLSGDFELQRIMYGLIREFDLVKEEVTIVAQALLAMKKSPYHIDIFIKNPRDQEFLSMILKRNVTLVKGKLTCPDTLYDAGNADDDEEDSDEENAYLPEPVSQELNLLAPVKVVEAEAQNPDFFQRIEEEKSKNPDVFGNGVEKAKPLQGLRQNSTEPIKGSIPGQDFFDDYTKRRTPKEYEDEIEQLTEQLRCANENSMGGGLVWEMLDTLSFEERDVLKYIQEQKKVGKDIRKIDHSLREKHNVQQNKLDQIKNSIHAKMKIHYEEDLDNLDGLLFF